MFLRRFRTTSHNTRIAVACATALALAFTAPGVALAKKVVPTGFAQTAKLLAEDGLAGDGFGYSVATDGTATVVGAPSNDASGLAAGAAYVYSEADGWAGGQRLVPGTVGTDDRFGQAVAVSGDLAIVGSPRDDDLGVDAGAAYVFARTEAGWVEQAKLLPVGGILYGRAGAAVDIDGDTAIVGGGRKVFVYVRTAEGWQQQATLVSPSGVYDYFGCSIAIDSDTIIAGAHGFQSIYDDGRAYVFARTDGAWALQASLEASDGVSNDQFGFAVDVSGDTALVGAWGHDAAAPSAGAAYAFARSAGVWTQTAKLLPDAGGSYDYFGYFVSVSDGVAAVGAHGDDDVAVDAGATYLYDPAAGFAPLQKLTAEDGAEGDLFGNCSAAGDTVVAGAIGSDTLGLDAGAAYVFEKADATKPGKKMAKAAAGAK